MNISKQYNIRLERFNLDGNIPTSKNDLSSELLRLRGNDRKSSIDQRIKQDSYGFLVQTEKVFIIL